VKAVEPELRTVSDGSSLPVTLTAYVYFTVPEEEEDVPPSGLKGDVNLDGAVDSKDLTALARHVAHIAELSDPQALANAEVTGDGEITAADLTKLARKVAGIQDF
ncbi:MAG: dockerin type I repeat-containing protein, partial [Firmicutes bacterium]|nr:dockerin type I repeat-containing protein [Bacillota bacterium]